MTATEILRAGQKFRFMGRGGIERAKDLANRLQGHCIRTGSEIEITCDTEVTYTPLTNQAVMKQFLSNGVEHSHTAPGRETRPTTTNGDAAPRFINPGFLGSRFA